MSDWAVSNIHGRIQTETGQEHSTRQALYGEIETLLERPIVSFFTSFVFPVQIEDDDADIIQSILGEMDTSRGFALFINSPGGDGLAAERIIKICRSCSGTGEYWAIVAGKAKSAATMICMGASKILMAPPSELGPIDPQIIRREDGQSRIYSAHSLVKTYESLFAGATRTKGNLEPFIQQLARFDAREISRYKSFIELSEDIAVKSLASGMMKGKSAGYIKRKIRVFLDPSAGTVDHGRPIYCQEADECGLEIEQIDIKSALWKSLYQLYVRAGMFVTRFAAKSIENRKDGFSAGRMSEG
jgi:hypothetical protein